MHNKLFITVKLPYSVFPVSTPLSMKDKGPDGSGQIRLFLEKVRPRPTQLLRGEKDEPDMCGLNR